MKFSPQTKSCLLLGAVFVLMYILNTWMPLHRDDYEYSLIWNTSQHIASVQDVFTSLYRHYMQHGGRMVSYFLLDLLLMLGKPLFDVISSAIFVGFIVLLACHAKRSLQISREPVLLSIAAILVWLSYPHFGEVIVWMDGAITYLWTGFFAVLFLLPYNLQQAGAIGANRWLTLPMLLVGFCAGWSVENLAVTVVTASFLLTLYCYRQGALRAWMLTGCIGALIGAIGLIAAPGNYVRYDQGSDRSFLLHIGNQFAGNGEMLLYLLPVVLLLLLSWKLLRRTLAERQGIEPLPAPAKSGYGHWLLLIFILCLIFSYFNGAFIAGGIRDFLVAHILVPLHLDKPKTISHFANVMAGFEEMAIYWFSIFYIYSRLKKSLGLHAAQTRQLKASIRAKDIWQTFPTVRYSALLFTLAFFTNFVMLAAPTFPARATFGAVTFILIGTLALLRIPELQASLFEQAAAWRILRIGGLAITLFIVTASFTILHTLRLENDARIAMVREASRLPNASQRIVTMPPIELKNRALRHIFFEDFSNGVTKDGLCRFYGIKDIKVQPGAPLTK